MSTFNTENIENLTGGAPDFSQGVTVGGTSITSLVNMTEFYDQASKPSSPANGAVWWDGTNMYQYMNSAWRIVSVTPPPAWFGDTVVQPMGTYSTSSLDTYNIATPANATNFGYSLTVARNGMGSCSDGSKGLFGGGAASTGESNVIDYITFATPSNATDFGDLTVARSERLGSCSNGTYGLFAGGYRTDTLYQNVIDYITMATTGNATDFGDMTYGGWYTSGCGNETYGLFKGGYTTSSSIEYVTIATPGNTTTFGDLTVARFYGVGVTSNRTRAVFGGGWDTPPNAVNIIDYVTIATPSNATDFGDLTVARAYMAGAVSNGSRAVFTGGGTNTLDYVTIDTPGNATDFGDSTGTFGSAPCSGS